MIVEVIWREMSSEGEDRIAEDCMKTLEICEEWEEATRSTDIPAEMKIYSFCVGIFARLNEASTAAAGKVSDS